MSHTVTRTHLIAPKELIEEVDRIVGPRRRSEFVATAISEKLKREKLLHAIKQAAKLPPAEGIPEWDTSESTSQWVHDIRAESDRIRKV